MMSRKWAVRIIAGFLALIMILSVVVVSFKAFGAEPQTLCIGSVKESIIYKVIVVVLVLALVFACSRIALRVYGKKSDEQKAENEINNEDTDEKQIETHSDADDN